MRENIAGEKRVSHVVKHDVDWAIVVGSVLALVALWYFDPFGKIESDEESSGL